MVPLFPWMVFRYGVQDIPTTVVNGQVRIVGPVDEDEYVSRVLAPA